MLPRFTPFIDSIQCRAISLNRTLKIEWIQVESSSWTFDMTPPWAMHIKIREKWPLCKRACSQQSRRRIEQLGWTPCRESVVRRFKFKLISMFLHKVILWFRFARCCKNWTLKIECKKEEKILKLGSVPLEWRQDRSSWVAPSQHSRYLRHKSR